MAYHALGGKADSDGHWPPLIPKYEKDAAYFVAVNYVFRGHACKAFDRLDKAVEYDNPGLVGISADNLFVNLHSDPRWPPSLGE